MIFLYAHTFSRVSQFPRSTRYSTAGDIRHMSLHISVVALLVGCALLLSGVIEAEANGSAAQGFAVETRGGPPGTIVRVTNLKDSGPGSLREAVSRGNRTVVFDVSGTILLSSRIYVRGANITIDGFSAPPPGITLKNYSLRIAGSQGAHDIIVRGIRVRGVQGDGISISVGAYNIVIDHVSIEGARDEAIGITRGAFDITVQWSILAGNGSDHNFLTLIGEEALRITLHHNLFVNGASRNPQVGWDTSGTTPPDTVADVRNNLIWNFLSYGTIVTKKAKANVVNNVYYSSSQRNATRALTVLEGGTVYAKGNVSLNGVDVDGKGNRSTPFFADPVGTTDACTAAQQVLAEAGVDPLDVVDRGFLSGIALSSCGN